MKITILGALAGFTYQVTAHATWQDLWVDGVDQISSMDLLYMFLG